MRVLFVGMNPARVGPRDSQALKRLASWATRLGIQTFSFVNAYHGPLRRVEDLPFLRGACEGHDKVIALGAVAASSLSKIGINHFRMPHPSGRNRQLNDPELVEKYLRECEEYLAS